MTTIGMSLIEHSTAKGHEDEPVFNQWRVAIDAYEQMVMFLELTPNNTKFTQHDRESIERDLERLAQAVGQMNAGQKGNGVNFDEIPHIMARIAAACMHMKLSGALDRLEVDK
jgi:hypothetical protein